MNKLPVIIIAAYNRPECLIRLLQSLENAKYSNFSNIDLVISIDGGGLTEITTIARNFQWLHGTKKLVQHKENLGLRNHILSCGELSNEYDSVIILEDDCFVSRNFYDYACQALRFYEADEKIAGMSLYGYQLNENAFLPFRPIADGFANYFAQVPSSWGQIWTSNQWKKFRTFYDTKPVITPADQLPQNVKEWPETSWKKYFYQYMVKQNLFFVYPMVSQATNFGDEGTHFNARTEVFQVPLEAGIVPVGYNFISFEKSNNKYDAYFEMLPACLSNYGVDLPAGTGLDTNGTKQLALFNYKYWYSIKDCATPIRSYAASMKPLLQNIIQDLRGESIHYAAACQFADSSVITKNTIIRNDEAFGYELGVAAGRTAALESVQRSRVYKVGYYLSHPLRLIKGLIRKIIN